VDVIANMTDHMPMTHQDKLKFEIISSQTLRESVAEDDLPAVEKDIFSAAKPETFGLSCELPPPKKSRRRPGTTGDSHRRHTSAGGEERSRRASLPNLDETGTAADELRWMVRDAKLFQDCEVMNVKARLGRHHEIDMKVRMLCHSRNVVRDDLTLPERLAMRQVALCLGDFGQAEAPWTQLCQPAAHLYRHGFNILWIEVPAWVVDKAKYMKFGSELLVGILRFVKAPKVNVVARGTGGGVFMKALSWAPELFANTHIVYNMDFPNVGGAMFPSAPLFHVLEQNHFQLWFAYCDDEFCDRSDRTSADAVYRKVCELQGKLQREKKVKQKKVFDEIIITENVNSNPHESHVTQQVVSQHNILLFSKDMCKSMYLHFLSSPGATQESTGHGLLVQKSVGDHGRKDNASVKASGFPVLSMDDLNSLRKIQLGMDRHNGDRVHEHRANRRRLVLLESACAVLEVSAQPSLQRRSSEGFAKDLCSSLTSIKRGDELKPLPDRSRSHSLSESSLGSVREEVVVTKSLSDVQDFLDREQKDWKRQESQESTATPQSLASLQGFSEPGSPGFSPKYYSSEDTSRPRKNSDDGSSSSFEQTERSGSKVRFLMGLRGSQSCTNLPKNGEAF
jgi:hypothetical protein